MPINHTALAHRYIHSDIAMLPSHVSRLFQVGSDVEEPPFSPSSRRRDRLWELSSNLHCSIIGTCLTTSDLRGLLAKLRIPPAELLTEHDLHTQAVARAGRKDDGGKLLHKLMDRRHARDVQRFERAGTVEELRSLWRVAVDKGEIPGAYWAVLTHPRTDRALVKEVFGEVHMLSHLVGRSVRADLRRLADAEGEVVVQAECIAELSARIQDLTRERVALEAQHAVRTSGQAKERSSTIADAPSDDTGDATIARLKDQLARIEAHAKSEEDRRAEAERAVRALAEDIRIGTEREEALRRELESLEAAFPEHQDEGLPARFRSVAGLSLLYVGGRPRQVAQARRAVRARGAELLSHDGGVEDASTLLPGLVSKADAVLFPVDCVSHDAVGTLKRCCRELDRQFIPLRSASLASLLAALETIRQRADT